MAIKTQTSYIKECVESIQLPYSGILDENPLHYQRRGLYFARWEKTAKKLEFLIKCIRENYKLICEHGTKSHVDSCLMDLGGICTAIGLYQVFMGTEKYKPPLWSKLRHDDNFNPAYWWDFMGDQSIRDEGGYVAVLLSPLGVEYMNRVYSDIRSIVPHCSYTDTE